MVALMYLRKAMVADLPRILAIIERAKAVLKAKRRRQPVFCDPSNGS